LSKIKKSNLVILTNCEGGVGMKTARDLLLKGGSALDVVEQGIRVVEADVTIDTVGRGGSPNLLGEMECDAAVMDGATRLAGSVGALKDYIHAISVARAVMEKLPHIMLVGDGAHRFAQEISAEKAEMLTDDVRTKHEKWLKEHVQPEKRKDWPDVPLTEYAWISGKDYAAGGTVIYLVHDALGNISAGASTSGWARSYPGRLGDSPIIGAGLYADNRYGTCACTHIGEMVIRAGTARSVVLLMKKGASIKDACFEAMADLLGLREGELGPVVIHALDRDGGRFVLSSHNLGVKSSFYYWNDETQKILQLQGKVFNGLKCNN
jgi:beta-aspartyl-peptidase (threonine type)